MSKKIPHGLNVFDLAAAADIAEVVWDRESPENAMLAAFEFLLSKSAIWAPVAGDEIQWLSECGWIGGEIVGVYGGAFAIKHNDGLTECYRHQIRPCGM